MVLLLALSATACSSSGSTGSAPKTATQVITDTAGRHVRVPLTINRIVTVGYPPVSDGWIIALGGKKLIVNGFPGFSNTAFYRSDQLLVPGLASQPNVESALGGPINPEKLLADRPDVVITADAATAEQIQKLGVPALDVNYLSSGLAMEHDVTVLGQLLGRQKQAAAYVSYFNNIIGEVHKIAAGIPNKDRLSAIYLAMDPWNPDVIIAHDPSDVPALMNEPQFSQLAAVRTKRVNVIPEGVNTWGDNTVEQPLGLLWTAKDIYPKQFAGINLVAQAQEFYSRFFGVDLSASQATDLITSHDGL
jgi:iron complex transport system substrate-binding protein